VWTMTAVSPGNRYWVLYEGVPGGSVDDGDWYFTSDNPRKRPIASTKDGDIGGSGPEWIAFGDNARGRVLFLAHPHNDRHPDRFYLQGSMTVFGFGRGQGTSKYLTEENEPYYIGFCDDTTHGGVDRQVRAVMNPGQVGVRGVQKFPPVPVAGSHLSTRTSGTGRMFPPAGPGRLDLLGRRQGSATAWGVTREWCPCGRTMNMPVR
jgi:hypothetical protein